MTAEKPILFSGLLVCGICGGAMTIKDNHRYVCRCAREEGTCSHARLLRASEVEGRVVTAIQGLLRDQDMQEAFASEYRAHAARIASTGPQRRAEAGQRLARAERAIEGLMKAIEDGLYSPDLRKRLDAAQASKAEALKAMTETEEPVVKLMTGLKERFAARVDDLARFMERDTPHAMRAKAALRSIVQCVTVFPCDTRGLRHIECSGNLSAAIGGSGRVLPSIAAFRIAV